MHLFDLEYCKNSNIVKYYYNNNNNNKKKTFSIWMYLKLQLIPVMAKQFHTTTKP